MGSFLKRPHRLRRAALPVLLLLAVLLLPSAAAATHGSAVAPAASGAAGLQARVTWSGTDVRSAAQPSSALTVSFAAPIDVRFSWASVSPVGAAPTMYNISTARLQLIYLGLTLSARDVTDVTPVAATNGSFDMQWDPGVLRWVLEGAYELTASLVSPNGSTAWSESFFIHAEAPYSILAAIPILLLIIAVYEIYSVAVSGRRSRPPASRARAAAGSGTSKDSKDEPSDEEAP